MDKLREYAASGSNSVLVEVSDYFKSHLDLLTVDHDIGFALIPHLMDEIEKKEGVTPWFVLVQLFQADRNAGAVALLNEFQFMHESRRFLEICAELLQTTDHGFKEAMILTALVAFLSDTCDGANSLIRRRMASDTPGLIALAVKLVDRNTQGGEAKVSAHNAIWLLCGLAEARMEPTFLPADGCDRCVETFLRQGGLNVLIQALHFAVKWSAGSNIGGVDMLLPPILAMGALMTAFLPPFVWTADDALYRIDRNARFRMNVTLHMFLSQPPRVPIARQIFILNMVTYFDGLCYREGGDALKECLLYKPRGADQLQIVVLLRNAAQALDMALLERNLVARLQEWAAQEPAVAYVLALHAAPVAPPDRSEKDRHCALPGCTVTGAGLISAMMKCGRCKAVYYCSEAHQHEHWPAHKKECVKAAGKVVLGY